MSRRLDVHNGVECLPPEMTGEVRAQLERVLSSPQFRGSKRCLNLLRHLTERTLSGDTGSLKERPLGVEVFGREPDYDTNQDPIVRATAAEIRKRLAQYYQHHEAELRIELAPGSYVLDFHEKHSNGEPARRRRPRWLMPVAAAGASGGAVLLLALAASVAMPHWTRSDLDRFWAPLLSAPGNVLVSVGQPVAYNMRSVQAQDALQGLMPEPQTDSAEADVIQKRELVVLRDRYVALGDAVCLARITSLLGRHGRHACIRGEQLTTFADLSENSAVLIGAFDNQWTMRVGGRVRFAFAKDTARSVEMVVDNLQPQNTEWSVAAAWPQWDIATDYAIVSRLLDTSTNRPVVIAAGITHYGTRAAGDFITNDDYFSEAAAHLPRGWDERNLQIVLEVPVVKRVPGHPRVLATHVW